MARGTRIMFVNSMREPQASAAKWTTEQVFSAPRSHGSMILRAGRRFVEREFCAERARLCSGIEVAHQFNEDGLDLSAIGAVDGEFGIGEVCHFF
ncbi:MAG: hypothetical protein ABR987_12275 [Terracidiphilus sp.]